MGWGLLFKFLGDYIDTSPHVKQMQTNVQLQHVAKTLHGKLPTTNMAISREAGATAQKQDLHHLAAREASTHT